MTIDTGENAAASTGRLAQSWKSLRANEDIQFSPVTMPDLPPREPNWLERFFQWLGEMLSPLGSLFGSAWPVVKWVLLALLIGAVLFILYRILEPYLGRRNIEPETHEAEWLPGEQEALALLEDADRLASQGRFGEATHLLLKRSINQIASARPEWVEPSSTARELAAIAALPGTARSAFGLIAERVERSLFALRSLEEHDWVAARAAYADFALARLDGSQA